MIDQSDPLANDQLALRLREMTIATPPMPRLAPIGGHSVRRPAVRRRGWLPPVAGVAAALALALSVTALAYPGGLAALTQNALQAAGLKSSQVQPLAGSGETAGVKVSVNGGYADSVSTVLFVSIDLPCTSRPCGSGTAPAPHLTDQFGTRYDTTGGWGIGVGYYPIFFDPLSGGVGSEGARLTLHVPISTQSGRSAGEVLVPVSGTLSPGSAHELRTPAAVVDSGKGVTYAVTGLVASGSYLEVHTRLTGNLNSVITHSNSSIMSGETWPGVFLVDPSGKWSIPLAGGNPRPTVNASVQDETRIFAISGPGIYHLVVATSDNRNSVPGPAWTTLAEWTVSIP